MLANSVFCKKGRDWHRLSTNTLNPNGSEAMCAAGWYDAVGWCTAKRGAGMQAGAPLQVGVRRCVGVLQQAGWLPVLRHG